MKFFFVLIFTFSISAAVKHDSVASRLHDYSYDEFCKVMNAKSSLLTTAINSHEIECFNQKYKIREFCIKKMPLDSNFTRGFGVESEKRVYCEEAVNVSLSIDCKEMKGLCRNAQNACEKLKNIYAYSLENSHHSVTNGKLNCYYTKKNAEEDLNEI